MIKNVDKGKELSGAECLHQKRAWCIFLHQSWGG